MFHVEHNAALASSLMLLENLSALRQVIVGVGIEVVVL
jgi:hypothetical protein